jgi:hypothetical protein
MNGGFGPSSCPVSYFWLKFNACPATEASMKKNNTRRRQSVPAVAFIYLAMVSCMVLLFASRALAVAS